MAESRRLVAQAIQGLKRERAALERQRRANSAELGRLDAQGVENGEPARRAEIHERSETADRRLAVIKAELKTLLAEEITENQVATALAEFDAVWGALKSSEQVTLLNLAIKRVVLDGPKGNVAITFRPSGLTVLNAQNAPPAETAA